MRDAFDFIRRIAEQHCLARGRLPSLGRIQETVDIAKLGSCVRFHGMADCPCDHEMESPLSSCLQYEIPDHVRILLGMTDRAEAPTYYKYSTLGSLRFNSQSSYLCYRAPETALD